MNQLELHILGMSRSGNHAITDWIFLQAKGRKLLLNCAEGKTNPFLTCRPLEGDVSWRADPPINIEAERSGRFSAKDLLIHTYEDSWLGHAFSREFADHHDAWVGPSRRRVELVILRDPFNLFASRTAIGCALSSKIAPRMWHQHAGVALSPASRGSVERRVVIYNRWARDRAYRRDLARFLGVPFTDRGFDAIPACGGGSSFDGTSYDGRATAMPTDERWRRYADRDEYRNLFDVRTIELSERIFGPAPRVLDDAPTASPGPRPGGAALHRCLSSSS